MYDPRWFTKPRVGAQLNRAHPLARGLVGYWLFNEGSGTKVYDVSGNGNTGTLTNFALSGSIGNWVGSPMGGGLDFSGTGDDDHIIILEKPSLLNLTQVTVITWIKFNSIAHAAYSRIFSSGTDGNAANTLPQTLIKSNGKLYMLSKFSAPSVFYNGTGALTLTTGVWYQIVLTYHPTYGQYVYVNCILDAIVANQGVVPLQVSGIIGGVVTDGLPLEGVIDRHMVYNRALSFSEIQTLYANPNINFMSSRLSASNPTLYGLGAWSGKRLATGATGTLTADSLNNTVEAGMAISFKKN